MSVKDKIFDTDKAEKDKQRVESEASLQKLEAEKTDVRKAIKSRKWGELLGYDTGYKVINEHTAGLRGFVVIASAPNLGKTTLSLNILFRVATKQRAGLPHDKGNDLSIYEGQDSIPHILYFSFDMSKTDIELRLAQIEHGFEFMQLKDKADSGYPHSEKHFTIYDSVRITQIRTKIEETTRLEVIEKIIEQQAIKHKKIIVCIDYFHCLVGELLQDYRSTTDAERALVDFLIEIKGNSKIESLVVISEKKKDQETKRNKTLLDINDLMGSARLGYAPDFIIGLNDTNEIDIGKDKVAELKEKRKHSLLAFQVLKARDGGKRSRQVQPILFEFHKNKMDFVLIDQSQGSYFAELEDGTNVTDLFELKKSGEKQKVNESQKELRRKVFGD